VGQRVQPFAMVNRNHVPDSVYAAASADQVLSGLARALEVSVFPAQNAHNEPFEECEKAIRSVNFGFHEKEINSEGYNFLPRKLVARAKVPFSITFFSSPSVNRRHVIIVDHYSIKSCQ
jgi:hypothetical protein